MKTDDLIALLATGDAPVDTRHTLRGFAIAAACGAAGAVLLMLLFLGLNPQLEAFIRLPMHWIKLGFALTLTIAALAATLRLARPGATLGWAPALAAIPLVVIVWLAAVEVFAAEPAQRAHLFFGNTWAVCPLSITLLSLPALLLTLWAMRGGAPTQLRLAGAVSGLAAGALGASVYTLHCPELAAPFIAIWYLLGMLVPAAIGALVAPRVLRW